MRTIACAHCNQLVYISDSARFLALKRTDRKPLCRECGKYLSREQPGDGESAGAARVVQGEDGQGVAVSRLVGKRRTRDKRSKALASRRLKRVMCGGSAGGVAMDF